MAALQAALTEAGLHEVETYIQTGNVRFRSPLRSRAKVEASVERVLEADCGFAVPTIVLSPAELAQVAGDVADLAAETGAGVYAYLLKERPTAVGVRTLEGLEYGDQGVVVRGRAALVWVAGSFHEAKISGPVVEKALGPGTARNERVLATLAERWGA